MRVSDVDVAIEAARAGATNLRSRYGTKLERIPKSSLDFATSADLEAELAILKVLRNERPADELLSEESGKTQVGQSGRTWLIDPLCGTLNFAAQTPLVGVNVALEDSSKTLAAVTADPISGEVMWTDGNVSYLRHHDSEKPMRPSPESTLIDVNLDGPFPNATWFRAVDVLSEPAFASQFRPRVSSTSLALAWVAAGRRVAYITDGDLRGSVHFSSGIALCQSAGCVVTNLRGGDIHSGVGGLVASSDAVTHRILLDIVNEQFIRSRKTPE